MIALDPAVDLALRASLALLLVAAALHKLRARAAFRAALEGYDLLPAWALSAAAALLPALELAIGAALAARVEAAAIAAAALLLVYAAAIGANLRRGRGDIDCGCAGPARHVPLAWPLVFRNLAAAAAALALALPTSTRALVWIDAATIAGAIAVLALLRLALDTAVSNSARLRAAAVR